jgi:hypothetical protein
MYFFFESGSRWPKKNVDHMEEFRDHLKEFRDHLELLTTKSTSIATWLKSVPILGVSPTMRELDMLSTCARLPRTAAASMALLYPKLAIL